MWRASKELKRHLAASGNRDVYNLANVKTGSFFRPVSSEGKSLDGKRVHGAIIDELHEHTDQMVVSKMIAGTKGRKQPLILEITNSGHDKNSVCYQHHDMSVRVLKGEVKNDSWFAYVCALDKDDDYRDPTVWIKANPNLDVSCPSTYLREQIKLAEGMPGEESLIRRLNFCEWTDAANPAISYELWMPCED
jgi:phage terminase large subunit-like protein